MKRRIRIAAASLMVAVGLIAAVVVPASAAGPPPGQGLVQFGPYECEGGVGVVDLFGPRGFKASTVFVPSGQHLSLLSLEITGTDVDGNPFHSSKTYGQKSGLTTFACTQHFEDGQATSDTTLVVGLVPPK